jgi:hypothetical protein
VTVTSINNILIQSSSRGQLTKPFISCILMIWNTLCLIFQHVQSYLCLVIRNPQKKKESLISLFLTKSDSYIRYNNYFSGILSLPPFPGFLLCITSSFISGYQKTHFTKLRFLCPIYKHAIRNCLSLDIALFRSMYCLLLIDLDYDLLLSHILTGSILFKQNGSLTAIL